MIHISNKIIIAALIFAAVFVFLVVHRIKNPDGIKTKNRLIKGIVIAAIAVVPGVCAATIAARTITYVYSRFGSTEVVEDMCEAEENECEEIRSKEENNGE
ncbi:MAG: hypothetical protein E7497_05750 [Ruminococcus sp.]|nr:hypothetical protein [Ruminococcus sp.]